MSGMETLIKRKADGTVVALVISGGNRRKGGHKGGRPRQELWQSRERVRLIASALQASDRSLVDIAREFGVTGERVRQIRNRFELRRREIKEGK